MSRPSDSKGLELRLLLAATLAVLVWSGIGPTDRLTWWLEVSPVLIGLPILIVTRRRFPLSRLLVRLLFLHAVILMVGGHYTYALVPMGNWVRDAWDLSRNHYDRLGHVAQGFVPALLTREILLRCSPLRPGAWLTFLSGSVCLAFSAFYELLEWWTALIGGASSEAFLGTQGDVWDTQWDMCLAMLGAIASLALLSRGHDRSMAALEAT